MSKIMHSGLFDKEGKEICDGQIAINLVMQTKEEYVAIHGSLRDALVEIKFKNGCFGFFPIYAGKESWEPIYDFKEDFFNNECFEIIYGGV